MADPVWVDNTTPLNAVNMNKLQTRDEKAVANGYASLDATGKIPVSQIGGGGVDYIGTWNSGTTYKQGDVVHYGGIDYLAVNPSVGQAPPPAQGLAPPGYGTSLPASPVNGQEYILVDNLTNPTYQWRFRYNAGATSPYKWEFVGGVPVITRQTASGTTTVVSSYVNLTTAGPSFILPRAGDYQFSIWAVIYHTAAQSNVYVALGRGDFSAPDTQVFGSVGTGWVASVYASATIPALAAAEVRLKYYNDTAGTASASDRGISIVPVRVS